MSLLPILLNYSGDGLEMVHASNLILNSTLGNTSVIEYGDNELIEMKKMTKENLKTYIVKKNESLSEI